MKDTNIDEIIIHFAFFCFRVCIRIQTIIIYFQSQKQYIFAYTFSCTNKTNIPNTWQVVNIISMNERQSTYFLSHTAPLENEVICFLPSPPYCCLGRYSFLAISVFRQVIHSVHHQCCAEKNKVQFTQHRDRSPSR